MGIEVGNITFNNFDQIMRSRGYKGTDWHGLSGEKISYKKVDFEGTKKCEVRVKIDNNNGQTLNSIEIVFPSTKNKNGESSLNDVLYNQYLQKLIGKYGQPDEDENTDYGTIKTHFQVWRNTPFRVIILHCGHSSEQTNLELSFCPKND